jgi:hypothetical protein
MVAAAIIDGVDRCSHTWSSGSPGKWRHAALARHRAIRRVMSRDVAATMRKYARRRGVWLRQGRATRSPSIALVGGKSGTARTHSARPTRLVHRGSRRSRPALRRGRDDRKWRRGSQVGADVAGQVLAAAFELVK